jgi:hypothetical protein
MPEPTHLKCGAGLSTEARLKWLDDSRLLTTLQQPTRGVVGHGAISLQYVLGFDFSTFSKRVRLW